MSTAPQQSQQNGSALATVQQGGTTMAQARQVGLAVGPQNLEQLWSLAEALAKSDFVPPAFVGKPANVISVYFMAQDLGVGLTVAMREIDPIEGRPAARAAFKVALVLQSGLCDSWDVVESTATSCTIKTKRRGKREASLTLTMAEVDAGGFNKKNSGELKDNWRKYPRIMLRHRVESWLADQEYPDVVRGLHTPDEVGGETVDERPAARASVPAETAAVIPIAAPPNPNALPPLPRPEPHDPVTGEVVDAPAPTPPAAPAPSLDAQVEQLAARIAAAKTSKELDELRPEIDRLAPKDNPALKEKRNALGRAMNAARTALQVR